MSVSVCVVSESVRRMSNGPVDGARTTSDLVQSRLGWLAGGSVAAKLDGTRQYLGGWVELTG